MAVDKYEDIWKLFKDYTFDIDMSNIVSDLLCCMCHGLLRNAQEGHCGCLYCWECVSAYLDADKKYCPGMNGNCGSLIIHMALIRKLDHPADSRVANLIIPCPIAFCESGVKLKRMRAHIEEWHYHQTDHQPQQQNQKNNSNVTNTDQQKLRQEMASVREMWQRNKLDVLRNEAAVREMRDELETLRAEVAQLREQIIATAKEQHKQQQEQREMTNPPQDDIEWEIEIDTEMEDLGVSLTAGASATSSATANGTDNNVSTELPASSKRGGALGALIRTEVRRQMGDIRRRMIGTTHTTAAEPIQLMTITQTIDLTTEQQQTNESGGSMQAPVTTERGDVVVTPVPVETNDASHEGTSSRRKLKRTLPVIAPPPPVPAQEPKASQKAPQPVTPAVSKTPSSTSTSSKTQSTTSTSSKTPAPTSTSSKAPVSAAASSKKPTTAPAKVAINTHPKSGPVNTPKSSAPPRNNIIKPRKGFAADRRSSWQKAMGVPPHEIGRKIGGDKDMLPSWLRGGHPPPFEFRVEGLADKINHARKGGHFSGLGGAGGGGEDSSIFSPAFYSAGPSQAGYKLCLRVEPHSRAAPGYLGLFFCLLRGEYDDRLPWPMRTAVTVSVIDQVNRVPYTSRTFDYDSAPDAWKYVFHRPAIDSAYWFGTPQFIHFDFLYGKTAALVLNDSVLIRCSTNP